MVETIANLALLAIAGAITAFWISALADSDGHCHSEDCEGCPYSGNCPEGYYR